MSERPETQTLHTEATAPTAAERLVRAVLERRMVDLTYEGQHRVVEPHLVGIHQAGEAILSGFQTGGFSRSGDLPGWRTFIIAKIESVEPREDSFEPRLDYNRAAPVMTEVFARA
jgi:hypothetical protein